MKTRATIIVAGDVQEVGFRAFVMRLGQKMKLTGNVENLFDGTVRILCEGEKETVESYIKKLKANDGTISVENVGVKYSKPQNKFKGFRTKITDSDSEMFQGFATAGRLLTELKGEVMKGDTKICNKVDSMANRIDDNFNKMGQKYDVISKSMLVAIDELKQSREEQKETRAEVKAIVENLTKVVQIFTEQQRK